MWELGGGSFNNHSGPSCFSALLSPVSIHMCKIQSMIFVHAWEVCQRIKTSSQWRHMYKENDQLFIYGPRCEKMIFFYIWGALVGVLMYYYYPFVCFHSVIKQYLYTIFYYMCPRHYLFSTDIYTCSRTGLHSQIPARCLAIARVTNVTLVVTESDTYNVINIRGATMGSIGGYVFTT